ncbi:type III-B CRISPR-associated protein Cas10/Cmr2 [Phormidium sp. FACHB-1136]|uniref:Cas10/Cmr2 second palm domain-containing protein n=1 Tax=Phormidium sp. FACHB-1136 TaxID=2692848 RepID=UPI001686E7E3|nr:type III-B CRISPR-associated protein Cas10/Cmr2 [Phormidium sp. FACHB-1136]MBD2428485.1 CRISPR-associated protein Cas10 [Phormidium sp. FACHB-1136]
MPSPVYTAITFAPVQGFIEKSRKLRDLYGSSLILSYLADQLCDAARATLASPNAQWPEDPVISPAHINVTQGTPNQILIRGEFSEPVAAQAFKTAWRDLCNTCREWIETQVSTQPNGQPWAYHWARPWQEWVNHAWEFFHATGPSPEQAKQTLMAKKQARAWTGVNWVGESSTLSGLDSRAWPLLGRHSPHQRPKAEEEAEVTTFYQQLSEAIGATGEAIITPREQLSIPELVKRLVTVDAVVGHNPELGTLMSFKALNRWRDPEVDDLPDEAQRRPEDSQPGRWTGWFQGDGDRVGDYLRGQSPDALHDFSHQLRRWGRQLPRHLPKATTQRRTLDRDGRIIYAGGDDFLGVLYRNEPDPPLAPAEAVAWLSQFRSHIWNLHQQPITVSVGFVWAAPNVPQRDVLQHCREAQDSAKQHGRDRIAFRILFNGGNWLEWVCPWWLLEAGLLESYRDRNGVQGTTNAPNWTHLYNDIATLEARHGFDAQGDVALALVTIYFGEDLCTLIRQHRWDTPDRTGILGHSAPEAIAITAWVIALAKVGFHLHRRGVNRDYIATPIAA